jgi:hypothetical protein
MRLFGTVLSKSVLEEAMLEEALLVGASMVAPSLTRDFFVRVVRVDTLLLESFPAEGGCFSYQSSTSSGYLASKCLTWGCPASGILLSHVVTHRDLAGEKTYCLVSLQTDALPVGAALTNNLSVEIMLVDSLPMGESAIRSIISSSESSISMISIGLSWVAASFTIDMSSRSRQSW